MLWWKDTGSSDAGLSGLPTASEKEPCPGRAALRAHAPSRHTGRLGGSRGVRRAPPSARASGTRRAVFPPCSRRAGLVTKPWPLQTEPPWFNENANRPLQMHVWCEREFTVKLVWIGRQTDAGFPMVSGWLRGHGFPRGGSCRSRGRALEGLIHEVPLTFGSLPPVSSCWAYPEPPTGFYDRDPQGVFSLHWSQLTNGSPLLGLLKPADSLSKILAATICLFLWVVTRKCTEFIGLQHGKCNVSKTERF